MTMTASQKKKRKEIEDMVIKYMNILDKTGLNGNKYTVFFKSMSDDSFIKWINGFLKDEDANFYVEVVPYKNEPVLKDVIEAAKSINVPLEEYVYYRHDGNNKDNPIRTAHKVPVGYVQLRRLQQILAKKNSYNLDVSKRNLKTGQITNYDKVARITNAENYALNTYNADFALKEFFGPRADDHVMKQEMINDIMTSGYTQQRNYKSDVVNKQTLNTVDVYFLGSGIKTDLITDSLELRYTKDNKEEE